MTDLTGSAEIIGDPWQVERIRTGVQTQRVGCIVQCFHEVDSTMDSAKRLAEAGEPEGTLVLAETQVRGRGRQGRLWSSPPGQGIYASLILRPALPAAALSTLTLTTATALAHAIETDTGLRITIKKPNDLMCRDRKLGGILTEASGSYVIVGFGINVNGSTQQLPAEAISLKMALGREVNRTQLLCAMLREFEHAYSQWLQRPC